MSQPDTCSLCNRAEEEHRAAEKYDVVHHPFTRPGQPLKHIGGDVKGKKEAPGAAVQSSGLPADPVLRFVLVEKGLISPDDLEKAEKLLHTMGVIRTHGHSGERRGADSAVGDGNGS